MKNPAMRMTIPATKRKFTTMRIFRKYKERNVTIPNVATIAKAYFAFIGYPLIPNDVST